MKNFLGLFSVLYLCLLAGCPAAVAPTVACTGAGSIVPGELLLDASGTTPSEDGYAITGYQFLITLPDGTQENFSNEDGKCTYLFDKVGTYKVKVISADEGGVSGTFEFEVIVENPFVNIVLNETLLSSYNEGLRINFTTALLSGYADVAGKVAGVEWQVHQKTDPASDETFETGTGDVGAGFSWKMEKPLVNINTQERVESEIVPEGDVEAETVVEPVINDHFITAVLSDMYGNSFSCSREFNVVAKDSPKVDFEVLHYSDPANTDSALELISGAATVTVYEYETVVIDASRVLASGSETPNPNVLIANYKWVLQRETDVADDYADVGNPIFATVLKDFAFGLQESGTYRIKGVIENDLELFMEGFSRDFIVSKNLPIIVNFPAVLPSVLYEGAGVTLDFSASSDISLNGKITHLHLNFADENQTDQSFPVIPNEDGSFSVEWVSGIFQDDLADNNYVVGMVVENELGNLSATKQGSWTVKDNTPKADIVLNADTVFFGDSVEVNLESCGSPDPDEVGVVVSSRVTKDSVEIISSENGSSYTFTPVKGVKQRDIYDISVTTTNRVGTVENRYIVFATDPVLLSSFYAEYQHGKTDHYAGSTVVLNATASKDGSVTPVADILLENYTWTVRRNGQVYNDATVVADGDNLGKFSLVVSDVGLYEVTLVVANADNNATASSSRSLVVLDNTPVNVVISEMAFEEVIASQNPAVYKSVYTFGVTATSPDGTEVTDYTWYDYDQSTTGFENKGTGATCDFDIFDWASRTITVVVKNSVGCGTEKSYTFTPANYSPPSVVVDKEFVKDGNFTISWTPADSNATSFKVFRKTDTSGARPWPDTTWNPGTTDLTQGENTFYIQELKTSGLWSNSGSVEVTYDTFPPNSPVIARASARTNDGSLGDVWSWVGGLDVASFDYTVEEGGDATWTNTADSMPMFSSTIVAIGEEKEVAIRVAAIDKAGNRSPEATSSVTVDRKAPVSPVSTTADYANTYTVDAQGIIAFTWNAPADSDFDKYEIQYTTSIHATPVAYTEHSYTPPSMVEGLNKLMVWAIDTAGNKSVPLEINVIKDITLPVAPVLTLDATTTAPANYYNNGDGKQYTKITQPAWAISQEGAEVYSHYRYRRAEAAPVPEWSTAVENIFVAGVSSYSPGTLSENRDYIVEVQSRDIAGNWSATTSSILWLDTVAPVIVSPATPVTLPYAMLGTVAANFDQGIVTVSDAMAGLNSDGRVVSFNPTVDGRIAGAYEDVFIYVATDNVGNVTTVVRGAFVPDPTVKQFVNGGFESFPGGGATHNGSLPGVGDVGLGWYAEGLYLYKTQYYRNGPWHSENIGFNHSFGSSSYQSHFSRGVKAENPRTGLVSYFISGSTGTLYESGWLTSKAEYKVAGSEGDLVYGYGKDSAGGTVFDLAPFKLYANVAYKFQGYVKTGAGSQNFSFIVQDKLGTTDLKIETSTSTADVAYAAYSVEYTPLVDTDARFVVRFGWSGDGGNDVPKSGRYFWLDDFTVAITNVPRVAP